MSNSAVWDDDAVLAALDSAAFWVKGLPFVKSLSGYWNFFLASSPANVPVNFYDTSFQDSEWETLPGKLVISRHCTFLCSKNIEVPKVGIHICPLL